MTCPPSKEHCYDRSDARNLIARDVVRDAIEKIRPNDISVTSQLPVQFESFMEMTKFWILGRPLRAKKGFLEEKLDFQYFFKNFKMYR